MADENETKKPQMPSNPDDEDSSIDFSRIKNFFKRKPKEMPLHVHHEPERKEQHNENKPEHHEPQHKAEHHAHAESKSEVEQKKDEEINIDFGKIKNFFRNLRPKQEKAEGKKDDDEISIDWGAALNFLKKHGIIFLVLIPVILSIYVRMLPDDVPWAESRASGIVYDGIVSRIRSDVSRQFPNLPEQNKNPIVDSRMNEFVSKNKDAIDAEIRKWSDGLKSFFKDDSGKTYMPDIDPYYWFRYTKNILEKGHPGDEIRNGKYYDNHQLAPLGRSVAADMYHSYALAYMHKIISIFSPGISLMRSMSYYPIIVSAMCVLLAFLIGRKISGNVGGFFAALMLAINTSFVGRTLFGHGDSDAWVVLFPLLVSYAYLEAMDAKKDIKIILLAALAGFLAGFFSYVWSGWWYIFDFLLAVSGVTFVYTIILHRKELAGIKSLLIPEIKRVLIASAVFFIIGTISIISISGVRTFQEGFLGPLGFSNIKVPLGASLWPNVLTTVAELNPGDYNEVVKSMGGDYGGQNLGGKIIWYIGIAGTFLSLLKRDEKGKSDLRYFILLGLWIIATVYASFLGIRFTLLLAPAFSIAFGTTLGMIYTYATKWLVKELHINKMIIGATILSLFLLVYIKPISASIGTAKSDLPLVNDAWYNSLIIIKQNSSENAIITSWWDFGHHFKAIADRAVTFDGTTQTVSASHWVGRLFSTQDEREAIGILRMLDCGSNRAFETVYEIKKDTHKTLAVIKKIIMQDKEEAAKTLKGEKLTEEQISKILQYSHCEPPEGYVIASDDMVGKSGVWGHFGAWNFERADIWFNVRKMGREDAIRYMVEKFNYSEKTSDNMYSEIIAIKDNKQANDWVTPWPGYPRPPQDRVGCGKNNENDTVLKCGNGLQVDLETMDVYAKNENKVVHPVRFAYFDEKQNKIMIKNYEAGENITIVGMGFTLVQSGSDDFLVVSSPEIVGGMYTQMFYMEGKGLKYFEPVTHQRGLGTDIYVYKAKWNSAKESSVKDKKDKSGSADLNLTQT